MGCCLFAKVRTMKMTSAECSCHLTLSKSRAVPDTVPYLQPCMTLFQIPGRESCRQSRVAVSGLCVARQPAQVTTTRGSLGPLRKTPAFPKSQRALSALDDHLPLRCIEILSYWSNSQFSLVVPLSNSITAPVQSDKKDSVSVPARTTQATKEYPSASQAAAEANNARQNKSTIGTEVEQTADLQAPQPVLMQGLHRAVPGAGTTKQRLGGGRGRGAHLFRAQAKETRAPPFQILSLVSQGVSQGLHTHTHLA